MSDSSVQKTVVQGFRQQPKELFTGVICQLLLYWGFYQHFYDELFCVAMFLPVSILEWVPVVHASYLEATALNFDLETICSCLIVGI
jgi:hypothetical protein